MCDSRPLCRRHFVLLFAAIASGCSPLAILNALVAQEGRAVAEDAYGGDPRQKLDIYTPEPAVGGTASYPVVVFFYGGSWNRGERDDYKFLGQAIASRGIVVAVADYRLYPQVTYPDFLLDSAKAVAWVRRNAARYGADPSRLFVMGHSAGAYNAAMIALDPRWLGGQGMSPAQLAGWIGLAGPYDFLPSADPAVRPVFHHPSYPAGAQPIDHASGSASLPAFLGAAAEDSVVDPRRNTVHLANALRAAGASVTLKIYRRVNHATLIASLARPLRGLAPVFTDITAFIHATTRTSA